MGWLNATPEKAEKSRREMYDKDSPIVQPVELSPYERMLVGYWQECGMVGSGGMNVSVLEWNTIIQWADRFYSETIVEWVDDPTQRMFYVEGKWVDDPTQYKLPITFTQCKLHDYELQLIRFISQEYVNEYSQASSTSRVCPKEVIVEEISKETAMAESMRLKQALMQFAKQD